MQLKTVCAHCFTVGENSFEQCQKCGAKNITHNNDELLQYGIDIYFQGYQNRKAIEHFIDLHGDQYKPSFHQIGPSEILGWIALACASGLTWDVIKNVLINVHDSAKSGKIRIKSPYIDSIYPSADEQKLEEFLRNDEEIKELVKYIQEYKNEFTDSDVHELVKEDTFFLQQELVEQHKSIVDELNQTVRNNIDE